MIRRPPRSTLSSSSAASDVYKRQPLIYFIMSFPSFAIPEGSGKGIFVAVSFIPPVPFSIANKLLFSYELENGVGWNMVNDPNEVPYNLSLIHISEPTRLLSISYAVFCLKKKKILHYNHNDLCIYS
eukprot:TRINITY_DN53663_c0_g1_i1.p1 TRINITY_DN53663_c0_g1~~TRINITY_DN53663_c0_g1_i1.p1  ORF type:complete len:127 (-),score=38.12 TRINITY_DN53663_c0_g1_i1:12-392(-)